MHFRKAKLLLNESSFHTQIQKLNSAMPKLLVTVFICMMDNVSKALKITTNKRIQQAIILADSTAGAHYTLQ